MHADESTREAPVADAPIDAAESQEAAPSRGRLLARRLALGFFGTIGALALLGVVLYGLGGPTGPTREQRDAYDALREAGLAEAPATGQVVVPIPGCVCHSDDPVAVVEHAEYRLRDCGACH